ncbi:AAA family ATPase [Actinosynnema sp. NPDC053489]|uniref:AAA family ATPase n=1 Tax=Actinosynnema sp. NPDC053489 TaxID=3363916 RepID=UPI0037C658B0
MAEGPQPGYVARREEQDVLRALDEVRRTGISRAVLLYGPGGVGKTRLVRAHAARRDPGVVRVPPIDVDDSEYWVHTNLEQAVAATLGAEHFQSYLAYLARLPEISDQPVGQETVGSHLGRVREQFATCYRGYVEQTGNAVVITLDTVESVRTMYLLMRLSQWMKALPRTLFVLSGRPPDRDNPHDLIKEHLDGRRDRMPTVPIDLGGFTRDEALEYFATGPLGEVLSVQEQDRLIDLTDGHPLWLAMSVDYLGANDPPPEMTGPGPSTPRLREEFRRRLVTPYRETGFWAEAVKRLAVVRQSVNEVVWGHLMSDLDLPAGLDRSQAWRRLLELPWVRPRANHRYVTLHDALAEQLAHRLIPLDDQDGAWRDALWRRAMDAYEGLVARTADHVREENRHHRRRLRILGGRSDPGLIRQMARTDAEKRELDQLRTAQLHYLLLVDPDAGAALFLRLLQQARTRQDMQFQELLCHELERFLPRARLVPSHDDVLGGAVRRFQRWLVERAPERHLEIALRIAEFLTQYEQPEAALELLSTVPEDVDEPDLRYHLANQRGNACMRIPQRIAEAERHFDQAAREARTRMREDRERHVAQADKELGFFYRNIGRWDAADQAYRHARDTLAPVLGPGSATEVREEMASIQTNWAYLQALRGRYIEARNLVESAIRVRGRLENQLGLATSLSVSGEVYRYDRDYFKAWHAYGRAEAIFESLQNLNWLGVVYQEQAICLFQAAQSGVALVEEPLGRARALIRQSIDICRDMAIRSYPSALNRAGRIFGHDDPDLGLSYLDQSVVEARRVADGWFLSANLIEYIELCYQVWLDTGDRTYRSKLDARAPEVEEAIATYHFRDLEGRWSLMRGHLLARDALVGDDRGSLDQAIEHYAAGFTTLANLQVGSHGASAIPDEFDRFQAVYDDLPDDVRRHWYEMLRARWTSGGSPKSFTLLLARLEQVY